MVASPESQPIIGEAPAFLEMLEHVSRAAPLSKPVLVVGERGSLSLEHVDVGFDQGANRLDGDRRKVAARPAAAALSQVVADHPVVRADVEAAEPVRVAQSSRDVRELVLLEYGLAEQPDRPFLRGHFRRRFG